MLRHSDPLDCQRTKISLGYCWLLYHTAHDSQQVTPVTDQKALPLFARGQRIIAGLGIDFQPGAADPHLDVAIGTAGRRPRRVSQGVLVARVAGRARHGETLWAVSPLAAANARVPVRIGPPTFIDPEGERLRG